MMVMVMVIADEEQLLAAAIAIAAATAVPFAQTQQGGVAAALVLPVHRESVVIAEGNGDVGSSEHRFTLVTISMVAISMGIGIRR
jgi:hypothetical protein